MIEGLKPYPKMKDSGVPWLGRVPEHWESMRCRYLLRAIDTRSPEGSELHLSMSQRLGLVPSSLVEHRSLVAESYANGKLCEVGDVVLNRLKAHLGVFAVARHAGVVSADYTVFRPINRTGVEYFEQTLRSPCCRQELRIRAKGIVEGFWRLYTDDFYDIRLPVPPLTERVAIIRFLAHADRRIHRLIRSKQKLVTLLEEQKQAIIHLAVTRGLDSSVCLKPTGQEWTGDIPSHWDLLPNRAFLRLRKEIVGVRSEDYVLLSLTKRGIIARDMENPEGKFPTSFDTYQVIEPGDFVFCLFDIDETPRAVGLSSLHGMITGAYTRFACDPSIADWVYLFYLAMDNGKRLKPLYTGLRKVITKSRFLGAKIPAPPPDERSRLIAEVAHATQGATEAIARAQREVDLLKEFRTRLISDVVTGKLDVREAAARLPEESIEGDDPFDDTTPDGEEDDDSAAESGPEDGDDG